MKRKKIYEVTALHIDLAGEYDYTIMSKFFRKFKNALLLKRRIRKIKFDDNIIVKIVTYTNREFKELQRDINIKILD